MVYLLWLDKLTGLEKMTGIHKVTIYPRVKKLGGLPGLELIYSSVRPP